MDGRGVGLGWRYKPTYTAINRGWGGDEMGDGVGGRWYVSEVRCEVRVVSVVSVVWCMNGEEEMEGGEGSIGTGGSR